MSAAVPPSLRLGSCDDGTCLPSPRVPERGVRESGGNLVGDFSRQTVRIASSPLASTRPTRNRAAFNATILAPQISVDSPVMKTVKNKTQRPISVPLPGGRKLHLGPGKSGQIAANAAEHQLLIKRLVDEGKIEILDEGSHPTAAAGGSKVGRTWMPGHGSSNAGRRSGDR